MRWVLATLITVTAPFAAAQEQRSLRPTLKDVFADVSAMLERVDPIATQALRARYEQNERELALLEKLQAAAQRGVPVSLPEPLRGTPVEGAGPELERRERDRCDELRAELALLDAGLQRRRSPSLKASTEKTALAAALLATPLELEVPMSPSGVVGRSFISDDPEGAASPELGEALAALRSIPEEQRSVADSYRMGRLLDRMGRTADARSAYESVVARDANGFFGSQAGWMLSLITQRAEIAHILERMESGSSEPKR